MDTITASAPFADDMKLEKVVKEIVVDLARVAPSTPDAEGQEDGSEAGCDYSVEDCADIERLERNEKTLLKISRRQNECKAKDPTLFTNRTLSELNTMATKLQKQGDLEGSIAIYWLLFKKAAQNNITHPEMYICHSNCSAACLQVELFDQALYHAGQCARLAEASLRRNYKASSSYIKSFVRKGEALLSLRRHREAVATFEQGLVYDPLHPELKQGLEKANAGVIQDLIEGRGHEHRSITYPKDAQRITYHPYSAPLHKVRDEDELPLKLLTPFQAENDHHIKDTYNYMTVQGDIRAPQKAFKQLEDEYYNKAWKMAIQGAVHAIENSETDCRVLNLGAGVGVQAVTALDAGARHITANERWLYLALACKETLDDNCAVADAEEVTTSASEDEKPYNVIYKRPTDLKIREDVPVCCNLLIANIMDEGLLTCGLIPAVRHALASLTTHEATVLPASATVYMQAVELRTDIVCGFNMSAVNLYRWHPAYATGPVLDLDAVKPLSDPVEVWYFDFKAPPEASETKKIDIEFTSDGRLNAVMYWFKLHLFGDMYLSSGPEVVGAAPGRRYLQPALQYLAGEMRVDAGNVMPIVAAHNTVRMRFDIEEADYLHLAKPDASFSHRHFHMLGDERRLAAYDRAIRRAVALKKAEDGECHVLDMGTGTGILALMAARAGADSVVACDLHESLCDIARKSAAANGLARKISVVHRDVALLQRGREVRPLGVNLVIADMFDAGLLGDQFSYLLELTKKKVIQPSATILPESATVYAMGIEALSGHVQGVNVSSFNKYRWDAQYSCVELHDMPHRRLTKPVKVAEVSFGGEKKVKGREGMLKLETVAAGTMNAVVYWFDLKLMGSGDGEDEVVITSAPNGFGVGGLVEVIHNEQCDEKEDISSNSGVAQSSSRSHYWGQALQYLNRAVHIEPDRKVTLLCKREGSSFSFALRPGVGDWVGRAPWKIEWGGGASIENPHFQRVHYCELLVRDFLMRCKSQRFPPIEKDINMVLAHCGSLFLDPASVQEAGHELVVLEKLHSNPEFSPGASLEALTRRPLRHC